MASEDVIELGSSDDEAEPAPKKKKPLPDAMVHIPSKLPGVTIKPAKSNSSSTIKALSTKPIIISKSNIKPNPMINKLNLNSGTIKVPTINKNFAKDFKSTALVQNKTALNPLSIAKTLSKTQIIVKKLPSNKRLRNPIEIQGPKVLNNLPPGITIKPVHNANITIKPVQKPSGSGIIKKRRLITPKVSSQDMLTVEIDDEDTAESTTSSPQWYLRPEEQIEAENEKELIEKIDNVNMQVDSKELSMETKNNMEPDTKFVEITIEDSPIKPIHTKHPDIGKELTITIEDSPVKPISQRTEKVESENEMDDINESKSPQSKKKLDYPKETEHESHIVEIEIDLKESESIIESVKKSTTDSPKPKEVCEMSPTQKTELENGNSKSEPISEIIQIKEFNANNDEFHPVYQKFISMCFQLENTEDMKKIVEKKIKAYYRQSPKDYVESEEFIDMVSSKIAAMKAAPEKMYLYIKDIVDELNLQRKMTKAILPNKTEIDEENASSDPKYEENQYNSKRLRQIRKLEKTIKKLHRAIQKLEEQEVDFDDDEDSVYLLTERYKERMVRVHAKFCQLTNTKMPSEPRIHIEARTGRPTGPAKKLEKFINKKVPIGTPLPFPDFHDVLRCVQDANEEEQLGWNDVDLMEEARDLFTRCGKKLQRRRQENEWRIAASRISTEIDPAESSLDLKAKLTENKTIAAKRESELLNKYVDRQNQLKLEAVEIGDKEADESPIESEDEDEVMENDNALEDKQKRKQRLKRLIEEKSKKDEHKENSDRKVADEKYNKNETTKEESSKDIMQEKVDEQISKEKSTNSPLVIELTPSDDVTPHEKQIDDKELDSDSSVQHKSNENNDSDTNRVESDIDELHLLQKLHSENEANTSTLESSDSETPIAISDTLESDSEGENVAKLCDIISIENSSYSESESIVQDLSKDSDSISVNSQNVEQLVNANFEVEYSSNGVEEITKKSKETVEETIREEVEENILLASSDEEDKSKSENREIEDTCINLRDDNISISETLINAGTVEEENLSNDSTLQENNNAVEIVVGSPEVEENTVIINMTQENVDDGDNTTLECSYTNEVVNDEKVLQDIVDRSKSDVNTDVQKANDITYKENSEPLESMDIDLVQTVNENSEIIKDLAHSNTNNEVEVVGSEVNDTITTNYANGMEIQ